MEDVGGKQCGTKAVIDLCPGRRLDYQSPGRGLHKLPDNPEMGEVAEGVAWTGSIPTPEM